MTDPGNAKSVRAGREGDFDADETRESEEKGDMDDDKPSGVNRPMVISPRH